MAKDHLCCILKVIFFFVVIGRDSSRGVEARGSGACSGGHRATQSSGCRGQWYTMTAILEKEAFNVVIIGFIPNYFRSTIMLFDLGLAFLYLSLYFSLGVVFFL